MDVKIKFDQKEFLISDNGNLVDAMEVHGIKIMAPCYRNKRSGCCKVCLVEVDGKTAYACCLKPIDGMNISYWRDDLIQARKDNARNYVLNPEGEDCCGDSCGCNTSSESSCC